MYIYIFSDEENIILIQISHDGNNINSPPNLMTEKIFKKIKNQGHFKFASFINIIYTGNNDFKNCIINGKAAEKLQSLSNEKNKGNLIY